MYSHKICTLIAKDEGFIPKLYKDIKGFNTIGYGFNLDNSDMPQEVAELWLNLNIKNIEKLLSSTLTFWSSMVDARQYVLLNMAYQIGVSGLLKFTDMLHALENCDYYLAADAMKNSNWYKEFTNRATRLINIMRSGEF
jgi:lysozyme